MSHGDRSPTLLAPGLAVLLAACGSSGSDGGMAVRDSAGVIIAENTATPVKEETWSARRILSIGAEAGSGGYAFHRINDLDVDGEGRIFVLDAGRSTVRVYDREGAFLREFGGWGDGPSRFRSPDAMALLGDTVVIFDSLLGKLAYFRPDGSHLGTVRHDLDPAGGVPGLMEPLPNGSLAVALTGGCGLEPGEDDNTWRLVVLGRDGRVRETLRRVKRRDRIPVRGPDNVFCTVTPVPFARGPRVAVGPGGVAAFGEGDGYEIDLFSAASVRPGSVRPVQRRVRRQTQPLRVTMGELMAYIRRAAASGGVPDPIRSVRARALESLRYPGTWPAFEALHFDDRGRLWVRRPVREGADATPWDLFGPDGRYLAVVDLPARLRVARVVGDRVYGTVRKGDGALRVEGYRIEGTGVRNLLLPPPDFSGGTDATD